MLKHDYDNCFYACRFCNLARSSKPTVDPTGRRLLHPCKDIWSTHFVSVANRLEPQTPDADYTETTYGLNDEFRLQIRQDRRDRIELALAMLNEGMDLLAQVKASPSMAKQFAPLIREQVRVAVRSLKRHAVLPDSAPKRCRCPTQRRHVLPRHVSKQTFMATIPRDVRRLL